MSKNRLPVLFMFYWDTLRRWVRMHGKNPKGGEGVLLDDLTATFNREFSNNTSTPLEDIFQKCGKQYEL